MMHTFFKTFRWWLGFSALIFGTFLLRRMGITEDVRLSAPAVMAFGVVFWFSKSTYEVASKKIFYTGLAILVLSFLLAWQVMIYYFYYDIFMSWWIAMTVIGFPVMFLLFRKDD